MSTHTPHAFVTALAVAVALSAPPASGDVASVTLRLHGDRNVHALRADAIDLTVGSVPGEKRVVVSSAVELPIEYEVVMRGVRPPVLRNGAVHFPLQHDEKREPSGARFVNLPAGLVVRPPSVLDATGERDDKLARWSIVRTDSRTTLRLNVDSDRARFPMSIILGFSTVGAMTTPRMNHIAALLPYGRVLLAGGVGSVGENLTSAEIYDPATGKFTLTDSMETARFFAAAVTLPNGRVLVVGGTDDNSEFQSAEIYDVATGSFETLSTSMAIGRAGATATLLNDGTVLITGGGNDSAEVYNPGANTFTATANCMSAVRRFHTATLLRDGRVLITGGLLGASALATADLYDPATRTFTPASGPMSAARVGHSATLLPDGTVLIAGGGTNWGGTAATAETFDPSTRTFTANALPMAYARTFHTSTLLANGTVLIAGHAAASEIYDPATDAFTVVADPTSTARQFATATMLATGAVLFVGGSPPGSNVPSNSAALYVGEGSGTITEVGDFGTGRFFSTATVLENGLVLVAGGRGSSGTGTVTAGLYDPATAAFTTLPHSMTVGRWIHTATLLGNGKVLLAGGSFDADTLSSAETFDPDTSSFAPTTEAMHEARLGHTATLLADGTVLIAGGRLYEGGGTNSAEIYDPSTGKFTLVGMMTTARSNHGAVLLPNGKVLLVGGLGWTVDSFLATSELFDPDTREFSPGGVMGHVFSDAVTTLLPDGRVLMSCGMSYPDEVTAPEIYDPASGTFTKTSSTVEPRHWHRAGLLPTGKVLLAGGTSPRPPEEGGEIPPPAPTDSTELYDPVTNTFTAGPVMSDVRSQPTLVMLPNGQAMILGGGAASSVDVYDPGSPSSSRRPVIASITNPLCQPAHLSLTGLRFTGDSEGGGGRPNSAPSNAPLLRLYRMGNEQQTFVPTQSFSASSFVSGTISRLAAGPYRAAIVSNGVASVEKVIDVETTPLIATYGTASVAFHGNAAILPSSIPSGYDGRRYAQRATASAGFTGSLFVNGGTGAVVVKDAGPVGDYTITVSSTNGCGTASRTFMLQVIGIASSIVAAGGTPQTAAVNSAFALPLAARVTDSAGHPIMNEPVTFVVPAAGASATLSTYLKMTDASGIASVTAAANGVVGAYAVHANMNAATAAFALTNRPATPTSVVATAASSTSVVVTWVGTAGCTYEVRRTAAGGATTIVGSSLTSTLTDTLASADRAYLYAVRAVLPYASPYGAPDLATTVVFTDPTLVARSTTIKAAHVMQLRTAVNAVRALAGLASGTYTDPVITVRATKAKAVHVTDLRTALGAARAALSLPALTYARGSLTAAEVRAQEIAELRNGVK